MKFLASLINNCRQPARRTGISVSARQTALFSPPHPLQEGLALPPDEQPLQPAPHYASNNLSDMASERRQNTPTLITGALRREAPKAAESAPLAAAAVRTGAGGRTLKKDKGPQPVTRDEPDTTPANADPLQPGTPDAPTGSAETPPFAGEPRVPTGQAGDAPAVFVARNSLSAAPILTQPAVAQISAQTAGAGVLAPQPSVDPLTPDAEQKSAADPPQVETRSGGRTQANQQPVKEPEGEPSAAKPGRHERATILARPMQQEQAAPGDPTLRQPVIQHQPREIPQVRIGQINVLVEDQAPARPKQNQRSARRAALNPFGLRGL